jgi:hypothetical protein
VAQMINQINDEMNIILNSKSTNNYIVTIAIGDQYLKDWETFALPSWKLYCEKYDIGLIVFTNDLISKEDIKWKKATWQKLLIGNTLKPRIKNIENICYLDTDILISPIAPNIFNNFNTDEISLVSLRKNLPYNYDEVLKKIAFFRNHYYDNNYPLDSALFITLSELYNYHNLTPVQDEACAGFFIFNVEKKSEIMYKYFFEIDSNVNSITGGGDQTHFNHFVQSNSKVTWLDYKFQAIWVFEMASKYPFLYNKKSFKSEVIQDCIDASLLDNYFLHFAGSWHESNMWKQYNYNFYNDNEILYKNFINFKKEPMSGKPVGLIKPK